MLHVTVVCMILAAPSDALLRFQKKLDAQYKREKNGPVYTDCILPVEAIAEEVS